MSSAGRRSSRSLPPEDLLLPPDGLSRFCAPSPSWIVPVCFLQTWTVNGALPVYQTLALQLWGDAALTRFNFVLGGGHLVGTVLGPLIGNLSDRHGRKPYLFLGAVAVWLPTLFLWAFNLDEDSERFTSFLVMVAMSLGVSGQVSVGIMQAYVVDASPPERRAASISWLMAIGSGFATMLAPLFFSWVKGRWDVKMFNAVLAATSVLNPLFVLFVPESLKKAARVRKNRIHALRSLRMLTTRGPGALLADGRSSRRLFKVLFAVIFNLYIVKMGFMQALGLFAQERFGFSTMQTALLQVTYAGFQIIAQLLVPQIVPRSRGLITKRLVIRVAIALACVSGLIMSSPGLSGPQLFVAQAVIALAAVAYSNGAAMATELKSNEQRGEAMMVLNVSMSLTTGLGPILFSVLVELFSETPYPNGAFLVLTGFMVSSFLLSLLLPSDAVLRDGRRALEAFREPRPGDAASTGDGSEAWILRSNTASLVSEGQGGSSPLAGSTLQPVEEAASGESSFASSLATTPSLSTRISRRQSHGNGDPMAMLHEERRRSAELSAQVADLQRRLVHAAAQQEQEAPASPQQSPQQTRHADPERGPNSQPSMLHEGPQVPSDEVDEGAGEDEAPAGGPAGV